ncbi:hypothetical protein KW850_10365 [Bacillus sp. sid0103]|uniref:hypothetical protein n=1 Tax=Bacillus sp. sid0103 TaxID=2856337 RepID=UPI001C47BA6D|nr:hypothetical protein [Bacillus sp. sid0103]MBV7505658.1 hypothetical protein [Bacillus sp. sid0103]
MKVELVPTSVVQGNRQCVFCSDVFDYVAVVNGESILEELKEINPHKGVTDQVIVLKKKLVNNSQQQIIDLEITVRCPQCHCNNRFTGFYGDSDKVTEL